MTKREEKLARIRAIVAKEGRATTEALRVFVESRNISHQAFKAACEEGYRAYKKTKENK